jgi:alanine dehydrogenase
VLYLTEEDVRELLPMRDAIGVMRDAFEALAQGDALAQGHAINQPRRRLILPTGSTLHSMAGSYRNYFGTKFYSVNPRYGMHAYFMLYDAKTAEPLALMEANALGQIRTGAASGYATDLLANPKADTLAVIGSGFQAQTQVNAIRAVRPIKTVRVWSRDAEKRSKFAEALAPEGSAQATATAEEAVRGAHIVVTATNSQDPVLEDGWIAPGTMINAMGSNVANRRELPGELVRRAALVAVDSLEQAKIESGDLILPNSWANVRELQNVQRHFDPSQITIFKSLGIGVEDVAAGAFVYQRALLTPGRAPATPERFVDRNRATR